MAIANSPVNIWIVIPAYNEKENLQRLLQELSSYGVSTLVIDDGSSDQTYEVAQKNATVVLRNEFNQGKGFALKKAIEYLLEAQHFEYIITMDADNQHSCEDLKSFFEQAQKGESFVVGNRMVNPVGMSWVRLFTNRVMSFVVSLLAGQSIKDSQCGYRLIRRDVLREIIMETERFEVESELIIKAARKGIVIKSIPIRSIYFKDRLSNINPFWDTLRFIKFLIKALLQNNPKV